MKKTEFCSVILDEIKLKSFMYAVNNHYWYQMYIDDLPIWGKKQDFQPFFMSQKTYHQFVIFPYFHGNKLLNHTIFTFQESLVNPKIKANHYTCGHIKSSRSGIMEIG